jgi:hypothetical protein
MSVKQLLGSAAVLAVVALAFLAVPAAPVARAAAAGPEWAANTTVIEACSCPMFCQCYFATKPAGHAGMAHEGMGHEGHGEEHFCRANLVYKVNKGSYGKVSLDGVKFWLANDLGDDFSDGEMDWCVVHFEPSVTQEQRDAVMQVFGHLFPVKWKSLTVGADAPIEWTASKDRAVAKLDGGKGGEVILARNQGMTSEPIVISNLKYWGAPRNDGFVLMQNEVEAYRLGDKAFEYKGTNGFMITVDMNSKDFTASK